MRIIDLELYRWHLHRLNIAGKRAQHSHLSNLEWWKEHGAFVSVLPRQVGKTEMLIKLATMFDEEHEDFVFVVPTEVIKAEVSRRGTISRQKIQVQNFGTLWLSEVEPENKHVLIDEFYFVERLEHILHYNWKSITMMGTLRV